MSYTLNGTNLGNVQEEQSDKTSGLVVFPAVDEDSTANEVIEYNSPVRTFLISGEKNGTTTDLRSFISAIEGILNGQQTATVVYHSDIRDANFNVKVKRANLRYMAAGPERVLYTIELIQGV